jgi:AcrR family transcriptional regulator
MPTPERTSTPDIVEAAREILEREGLPQLTMQAVAVRVGVRAPSLYKRVRNHDDLIRLVTEAALDDLGDHLGAVALSGDVRSDMIASIRALRDFARRNPASWQLNFTNPAAAARPDPASVGRASAPVLRFAEELAGPEDALAAARTLTAWAYGFISMELAGVFNLGGDLEQAFEYGISHLADALSQGRSSAQDAVSADGSS